MNFFLVVTVSTVALLVGVQLENGLLEEIGRLGPGFAVIYSGISLVKKGRIKKALVVTGLIAVVVVAQGFSRLNPLIGLIAGLLTMGEIIWPKESVNASDRLTVFWSVNLMLMVLQIIGLSSFFCGHSPWECSSYNILFRYPDLPYELALGQLRPPGLFPTQISFVYIVLINILLRPLRQALL